MQAVPASDAATEYIAARRADAAISRPWLAIRARNARLYCDAALSVQNSPISVCCAVRTELLSAPYFFARWKARAQAALVNASGGWTSARNWSALRIANGLNCVSHTPTGAGGVLGG